MNAEIGKAGAQSHFWEHLFQIFGAVHFSFQFTDLRQVNNDEEMVFGFLLYLFCLIYTLRCKQADIVVPLTPAINYRSLSLLPGID